VVIIDEFIDTGILRRRRYSNPMAVDKRDDQNR
jgi:hypothetical protein